MHEGALAVHEVELVAEATPRVLNRRRVAQHTHCALHVRQLAACNVSGGGEHESRGDGERGE